MKGFKTCSSWLHEKYREAVKFKCQRCNQHENKVGKLIPHRIKRGNKGGLYTILKLDHKENNIKVVCKECHKLFHSNDNRRIKNE